MEANIRRRVACEERAHHIVEKLLDNPITETYLRDSGQFITPSHYTDIVDERAIVKQCGYPVCNNELRSVLKQKYHITTKTNKVYDISERKNFCSNQCFKASKYFEKQILTTPVWMRDKEPPVQFKLLTTDINSGSLGTEVIGSKVPAELKEDLELLQKLDEKERKQSVSNSKIKEPDNTDTYSESGQNSETENISEKSRNDTTEDISNISNSMQDLKLEDPEKHVSQDGEMHHGKILSRDSDAGVVKQRQDKSGSKLLLSRADKQVGEEKTRPVKSKTDYLMELLSKRKHLLGKMADVQHPLHPAEAEKIVPANTKINSGIVKSDADSTWSRIEEGNVISSIQQVVAGDRINESDLSSSKLYVDKNSSNTQNEMLKPAGHCVKPQSKLSQTFPNMAPALTLVCEMLSEWVTVDTLKYLGLHDLSSQSMNRTETISDKTRTDDFQQMYTALGERLDSELKASPNDQAGTSVPDLPLSGQPTAPVPDIEELKQKTTDFTMRVREYYKGTYTYSSPRTQSEDTQPRCSTADEDRRVPVLPLVDSTSQRLIRCKIVLQRLDKSVSELLTSLNLSIQHVSSELRELVTTFSLSSTNITFKPGEWTLVALLLLKMLSRKSSVVEESFLGQKAVNFFRILLKPLACSPDKLDHIVLLVLETPLNGSEILGHT